MYYYVWAIAGTLFGIFGVAYALWRGGKVERIGATIIGIAWVLSALFQGDKGQGIATTVFYIDALTLCAFFWLSLKSRKIWTLILTALQLDTVLSHILANFMPMIGTVSYITAIGLWGGYGLIIALIAGVMSVESERRMQVAQSA